MTASSNRSMPEAAVLSAIPVRGMPEIRPRAKLVQELLHACAREGTPLVRGDILIVTHKIVSKAEGRLVDLAEVKPSARAARWGRRFHTDPRIIELALREARRIVRMEKGVLITETAHGLISANSGVDASNVDGGAHAVLLPKDPDRSAARIHRQLRAELGFAVPVIITDTFGRPWREGLTEVAIGVAGMKVFRDFRGRLDPHGYELRVSVDAVADALAAFAGVACGKLSRSPACIIRGFAYEAAPGRARDLVRAAERDLFR